jgi:hypothetical protein
MRTLLAIVLVLTTGLGAAQDDQQGRAIPAQQVTWVQPGIPPSFAQQYAYRLYITEESGVERTVPLASTLCGGFDPAFAECSTALPAAASPAIITGNVSRLSATDPDSYVESDLSVAFVGDQGCIYRNRLYAVGARHAITLMKTELEKVLADFQAAKFKVVSIRPHPEDESRVILTEECVGYLVMP